MSTAQRSQRRLKVAERGRIALLGVPSFALALTATVVTTYVPVMARRYTGSTVVIGLLIGIEGLLAMVLPLLFGTWSDQLRSRVGGRLPFVLGGAVPLAAALALLGITGALPILVVLVLVFFASYFVIYEPYRALYPDLIAGEAAGRAQSVQAVWRGGGTGLALVAGGLLFGVARWLPFVAAALIFVVVLAVFAAVLLQRGVPTQDSHAALGVREALGELRHLIAVHPALRAYLVANALWEVSLGAIKTFVILYLTAGLGHSVTTAALIVGAVALVLLACAPLSGVLADRAGRLRVLGGALWLYGLGLLVPLFTQTPAVVLAVVPLIAFGGAVVMSLPYAVLIPLMPARSHGALTGFYSLSRGLGTMLGPVLAGAAVALLRDPLAATRGYAAIWGVAGGAILLSIVFLKRLRAAEGDRRGLRAMAREASS